MCRHALSFPSSRSHSPISSLVPRMYGLNSVIILISDPSVRHVGRKCARGLLQRAEFCKRAKSRVHRVPGKPQYALIGVVWFVGTTFYSRRSRRGLSICILCHKCENRSESCAPRDSTSARGNMYQTLLREMAAVRKSANRSQSQS